MAYYYRVHPQWPNAERGAKGHALFTQRGGGGRICNEEYSTLYVADSPACAVAEVYANFGTWDATTFAPSPSTPEGGAMVVTRLEGEPPVVDLDDVQELIRLGIRPSRVVTRNYSHTRAWALAIWSSGRSHGARWWSYHEPDWGSYGLWDLSTLEVVSAEPLTIQHPAVVQAAAILGRARVLK